MCIVHLCSSMHAQCTGSAAERRRTKTVPLLEATKPVTLPAKATSLLQAAIRPFAAKWRVCCVQVSAEPLRFFWGHRAVQCSRTPQTPGKRGRGDLRFQCGSTAWTRPRPPGLFCGGPYCLFFLQFPHRFNMPGHLISTVGFCPLSDHLSWLHCIAQSVYSAR